MLTARHSNEQGPKWMQNLSRINEPETIVNYRRQDDVFGYDLQFLLSGVLPVLQNLSYKAQITRSEVLRKQYSHQKLYKMYSSSRRVTRRQVMRHFTANCTDHSRNGPSNIHIPYREQP